MSLSDKKIIAPLSAGPSMGKSGLRYNYKENDVKESVKELKEAIMIVLKPRVIAENRDSREIEGLNNEVNRIFGKELI